MKHLPLTAETHERAAPSAWRWLPAAAILASLGIACSSDEATIVEREPVGLEPAGGAGGAGAEPAGGASGSAGAASGPLYAVSTNVFGPEEVTGYLALVPSLDAGTTLDLDAAIEFPGGGFAAGVDGQPYVYVGKLDSPTIERWELTAEGTLQPGPTISFANLGLTATFSVAFSPIVDMQRSYFVDPGLGVIAVWNPGAMQTISTIPLGLTEQSPFRPEPSILLNQVRGDGKLFVPYAWRGEDWPRLGASSGLLAIDTASNAVVEQTEWEGCEYAILGGQTSDGTLYYSTEAHWALPRLTYGGDNGSSSCALRVLPGQSAYDATYESVDLSALVGGREVAGDLLIVSDERAFLRVWHDEDVAEPLTVENFGDRWGTVRAWRWWTWEIGAAQATEVPDQQPAAGWSHPLRVDGRVFVSDSARLSENGGRGTTPLYELHPSGELRPALTGFGQLRQIVRVR